MRKDVGIITNFVEPLKNKKIPQRETIEQLIDAVKNNENKLVSNERIKENIKKYSIPDTKINARTLFEYSSPKKKDWNQTMIELLENAYENRSMPDSFIFATGSTFSIPSPAHAFFQEKGWLDTNIHHCFNFGCLAAFPALEIAQGAISNPLSLEQRVDIFNTDIISRHFGRIIKELSRNPKPDQAIISTLFSDSAILYSVMNQEYFNKNQQPGLEILKLKRKIIPNSKNEMLWIDDEEFDFYLSKYTPLIIKENVLDFTTQLCQEAKINFQKEKNNLLYAIHPGGPKILDYVQERLEIDDYKIENSRKLFYNNGNISSASCPTLWKEIAENNQIPYGSKVLSLTFGPGLTIAGGVLKKIGENG